MVAALAVGGAAVGQPDSAQPVVEPVTVTSNAPAWRDLERAQYNLQVARQFRNSIGETIDRITRDLYQQRRRAQQLEESESAKQLLTHELEQLVVQEYISGGAFEEFVFVLDGVKPTNALWRLEMLTELAEIASEVLEAQDDVDAEQARTQNQIARLQGALPTMRAQIGDADQAISAAEWVVYIAEINDLADRELAQNGFIEPTERQWYNLRFCESSNNYSAASANGLFYGAYQFEPRTWETVGGVGNPAEASPEEQDARARLLYARRGDQPWPRDYCGRWLPRN